MAESCPCCYNIINLGATRLDEGLRLGHKLTLVSAQAGFGETTLLSEWLHGCGRPAGWLSLDEDDNDLARCLAYLIASLQRVDDGIGVNVQAVLQASQPQLPPSDAFGRDAGAAVAIGLSLLGVAVSAYVMVLLAARFFRAGNLLSSEAFSWGRFATGWRK